MVILMTLLAAHASPITIRGTARTNTACFTKSAPERHAPFTINQAARDRWMDVMNRAIDQADLPPDVTPLLREFLDGVATFMINRE